MENMMEHIELFLQKPFLDSLWLSFELTCLNISIGFVCSLVMCFLLSSLLSAVCKCHLLYKITSNTMEDRQRICLSHFFFVLHLISLNVSFYDWKNGFNSNSSSSCFHILFPYKLMLTHITATMHPLLVASISLRSLWYLRKILA